MKSKISYDEKNETKKFHSVISALLVSFMFEFKLD